LEQTAPPRLPERVLEATFERTRRSRQQLGWRAVLGRLQMPRFACPLGGLTALVLVAVVAFGLYVNRSGIGAGPTALPANGAEVGPGWYSVTVDGYRYTFRVPGTGWKGNVVTTAQAKADRSPKLADVGLTRGDASSGSPDYAGFELWGNATQVHRVRCQEAMGASNNVGPTAADLATAIASLDGFRSSAPTDVTVGPYSGKRLQLAVPADRWAACTDGAYRYAYGSFTDEDEKDREYLGPDQVDEMWILDLENDDRQLFLITYFPTTPAAWVDQLRQMVESVQIRPAQQ